MHPSPFVECDEMRRCGFGGGKLFYWNSFVDFRSTLDFIFDDDPWVPLGPASWDPVKSESK